MIRGTTILVFATAALGVALHFSVAREAKERERELARLDRDILKTQEAIHVLRAEWAYLNQPDRLQELARTHLELEPVPADRIVRLDDLPIRPPPLVGGADGSAPDGTPAEAQAADVASAAARPGRLSVAPTRTTGRGGEWPR